MYNLCLPFGALVVQLVNVVAAQSRRSNLDGTNGESPCCIVQKLLVPCSGTSRNCDQIDLRLGMTECTCNTVVYNLWSACLQSQNKAALSFTNWTAHCAGNLTTVTYGDYPMRTAGKVEIPRWAYVDVTEEGNFDADAPMQKSSNGWSVIQIMVPVILGISLLAIFALVLYWYRRRLHKKYGVKTHRQSRTCSWRRILRLSPTTVNSKGTENRGDENGGSTWVIDDFDTAIMARRSSPDSDEYSDFDDLTPAPSPFPSQLLSNPQAPVGQRIRPYHKHRHHSWHLSLSLFSGTSTPTSSRNWNPFKRQPKKVVSQPPRKGFRVDDVDLSTQAAESRRPTLVLSSDGHRDRDAAEGGVFPDAGEDGAGEGVGEDSVLLISREPGMSVPSAVSTYVHEQQRTPTVQMVIVPPSRQSSAEVAHSVPVPIPAPVSMSESDLHDPYSPPSPHPPPLPLSSPPSYHAQHSPLQNILIPNYTLTPSRTTTPSHSHSPTDNQNSNPTLNLPYQNQNPRSRTTSSESIGLSRPLRTDPVMLIPTSVRSAGYNPYSGSKLNLGLNPGYGALGGHSRSVSSEIGVELVGAEEVRHLRGS